jgi:biopolymer transport protein ExbD
MGMQVGDKSGSAMADINVTPLVDVVLVLLIIFMVVTQMLSSGKAVQLPSSSSSEEVRDMGQYLVIAMTSPKKEMPEGKEADSYAINKKYHTEMQAKSQPKGYKYPKGHPAEQYGVFAPRMWIDMREVHPWDVGPSLEAFLKDSKNDKKKYTDILVKGDKSLKWKDAYPILEDLNGLVHSIYPDENDFLLILEPGDIPSKLRGSNCGKPLLLATEKPKE